MRRRKRARIRVIKFNTTPTNSTRQRTTRKIRYKRSRRWRIESPSTTSKIQPRWMTSWNPKLRTLTNSSNSKWMRQTKLTYLSVRQKTIMTVAQKRTVMTKVAPRTKMAPLRTNLKRGEYWEWGRRNGESTSQISSDKRSENVIIQANYWERSKYVRKNQTLNWEKLGRVESLYSSVCFVLFS